MLKVAETIIPYSLNNIRGNKKEGALKSSLGGGHKEKYITYERGVFQR